MIAEKCRKIGKLAGKMQLFFSHNVSSATLLTLKGQNSTPVQTDNKKETLLKKLKFDFERVKNIVGKGENAASNQHYPLFSKYFLSFLKEIKKFIQHLVVCICSPFGPA